MPAQLHDAAMDAAYDYVDQADVVRVISSYSLDNTHAQVVTATLATTSMTIDTGDYAKTDGAAGVGSRKLDMLAKNAVAVTVTATATHVALCKASDTTVRLVTTCTSQALTNGNTVNIPTWKHEFGIPT